jgi:hypothetical protein
MNNKKKKSRKAWLVNIYNICTIMIFYVSSGNAQVYKGILITGQKGTPVEYANVGIVEKNIGTTSDTDGRFELNIPSENSRDTVRFSMIGYETVTLPVSDFINRNNDTIWMTEKIYSISEVVISASKFEMKILGNSRITGTAHMSLPHGGKGLEAGIILDPKKGNQAQLQTLLLNGISISDEIYDEKTKSRVFSKAEIDTLRFRVNLYRVNSKDEFENILTKPIYITYKPYKWEERKDDKIISSHPVEFDISEHQLVIDGKSLITVEFYSDVPPNRVWIRCHLRGPDTYFRATSQGKFNKYPTNASVGLGVKAKVMKK